MMVVVPALAAGQERNPPIVPAVIAGIVVLIAEHMGEGVHAPADVPDDDGADYDAPQPDAGGELQRFPRRIAQCECDQKTGDEIQPRLRERHPDDVALDETIEAVAQDVARIAVVADLTAEVGVFQKQPAHMRPEYADQRAMRIATSVGAMVMQAVGGDPARRRILHAPDREQRAGMLKPERAFEAAMREQAMVAKVHAEGAVDIDADESEHRAGPAVEPGHEGEQCQHMIDADGRDITPIDQPFADTERKRQLRHLLRSQFRNDSINFRFQISRPGDSMTFFYTIRARSRGGS